MCYYGALKQPTMPESLFFPLSIDLGYIIGGGGKNIALINKLDKFIWY